MRRIIGLRGGGALALATLAVPAHAAMDVATFIAKVEALKAHGVLALLSKDLKPVEAEARKAARLYQADYDARAKSGRRPLACPPKKPQMSAMEFFEDLKKIPSARRRMPMKDGIAWVVRRKFPCR